MGAPKCGWYKNKRHGKRAFCRPVLDDTAMSLDYEDRSYTVLPLDVFTKQYEREEVT